MIDCRTYRDCTIGNEGRNYVLKRILHDWSDEVCVRLLRNCREAMAENGRVLVTWLRSDG